jgi:ferritin-like metal-binding protein YciE
MAARHLRQITYFGRERQTMAEQTLKDLYIDELRDLYDAEKQLVKALPKMAAKAETEELRSGIEEHLEQTKKHAERIEQIFESLGEAVKGKKCKGMAGIVSEGREILGEEYEGALLDAAIIGAAQRVEHYEIAAYGTVREFAKLLGEEEAQSVLSQTLEEEKETDRKLTELATQINSQALESESGDDESGHSRAKPRAKTAGA